MPQNYVRLAFVQMFLIILVILFTGIAIKSRFAPLPETAFPVLVRDYGILLLLIPAAWCLWGTCWSRHERFDSRDETVIGVTGLGLCASIIFLGWLSCTSAINSRGIIISETPPSALSKKVDPNKK